MHQDAAAIWTAAINAVDPERLVPHRLPLETIGRIVVIGAGKAAAGLAAGVEALLGTTGRERSRVTGLVSVPAGCGRILKAIEVRETRPSAANLPTPAVVEATREMLSMLGSLEPDDLAIALITGGGSALLAAPKSGISLDEKIAVTRQLSESGADIATLNAARRRLSLVKGGGLARACTAGNLLVLVLSDVLGNDLDVIASGPCMPPEPTVPPGQWVTPGGCRVQHLLIGDNATAVAAAVAAARQRGYEIVPAGDTRETSAEAVGHRLAADAVAILAEVHRDGRPRALITGGEATVQVPVDHGRGGRNQQTVLAAIDAIERAGTAWPEGLLVASVGTDGEDGPTDAAGAYADDTVVAAIARQQLDLHRALARCDAYPLFAAAGGLIHTGPTGTNVADIRIVLARP